MLYLQLFFSFLKIGLFGFGGGLAVLSLIQHEVESHRWMTQEEFVDIVAVSQVTPGPIGINCATYVGYKLAGLLGATVATFGMVLPSFVVIFIVSKFLDNFLEIKVIANAFLGIKIAVGILIFDAAITMIKKMKKKLFSSIIMISAFLVMMMVNIFSWSFSSINLMLIAGVLSLIIFAIQTAPDRKGGAK